MLKRTNKDFILRYDVTYDCNESCEYCFSKDCKRPSKEIEKQIPQHIDSVLDFYAPKQSITLVLCGGEPTLADLEKILDQVKTPIRQVIILSNGTASFEYTISLAGFLKERKTKLLMLYTYHYGTIDFYKWFNTIEEIDETRLLELKVKILMPISEDINILNSSIEYFEFIKSKDIPCIVLPVAAEVDDVRPYMYNYDFDFDIQLDDQKSFWEESLMLNKCYHHYCSGGHDFVLLDPSGDLYACGSIQYPIGNVIEGNLQKIGGMLICQSPTCSCPGCGIISRQEEEVKEHILKWKNRINCSL